MPKRIQMSRQKPWRAENPDAVIVARPSMWGNPFAIGAWAAACPLGPEPMYVADRSERVRDREHAVALFREWVAARREFRHDAFGLSQIKARLAGRDLACWCPLDQPCHADVLLEIANPPALCPECRDGKCRNCVEQTLDDNDQWVPCGCPNREDH